MDLKIDHHYDGIVNAARWTEARSGNVGIELELKCEDGAVLYYLWITEKNLEKANRELDVLGITTEERRDLDFVNTKLIPAIIGREVTFRILEEDYKGKTTRKVPGIGSKVNDGAIAAKVASILVGPKELVITDADIPF